MKRKAVKLPPVRRCDVCRQPMPLANCNGRRLCWNCVDSEFQRERSMLFAK
jgi:hypothetical protein